MYILMYKYMICMPIRQPKKPVFTTHFLRRIFAYPLAPKTLRRSLGNAARAWWRDEPTPEEAAGSFVSWRLYIYGIFAYIYHNNQPNLGEYTIDGWYGVLVMVMMMMMMMMMMMTTSTILDGFNLLSNSLSQMRRSSLYRAEKNMTTKHYAYSIKTNLATAMYCYSSTYALSTSKYISNPQE